MQGYRSLLTVDTDYIQGLWAAKGLESGTPFTDIGLEDGEWYDYDEKAGEEVSVKGIAWEIRRA